MRRIVQDATPTQWICYLCGLIGWIIVAYDFTIYLVMLPDVAEAMGISRTKAAAVVTATLLSRLAGGIVGGWICDRIGRKIPFIVALLWISASSGATAVVTSYEWLLVTRALFGFGMGVEWTAGTLVALEHWPKASRGKVSGILNGSWAVGFVLAGVASGALVPRFGWQSVFIASAFAALLVIPVVIWVREPARTGERTRLPRLRDLLQRGLLRNLLWASSVTILIFCSYYAFASMYPTLQKSELQLSAGAVAWNLIVFNIGMMTGSILCGVVVRRYGIARVVWFPALISLLTLPAFLGMITGAIGAGAFLAGLFGVGFTGLLPLLLTGLFDERVRARAAGLVFHVGAVAASLVPMVIATLSEKTDLSLAWSIAVVVTFFEVSIIVFMLFTRPRDREVQN